MKIKEIKINILRLVAVLPVIIKLIEDIIDVYNNKIKIILEDNEDNNK